ncbi:MAG: hypothetical protein NVSMB43_06640 [Pseudarthrobacter sp.]
MPRQPKPSPELRPGQKPDEGSVSHSESVQTHEEILAYWTPERMAEAKPRELRIPEPAPSSPDGDESPAPDPS